MTTNNDKPSIVNSNTGRGSNTGADSGTTDMLDSTTHLLGSNPEQPKITVEPKQPTKKKKRIGRPKKKALAKAKNPVGRPKGDNSVIAEYKQRMIASPKSRKVLDAVLTAASDPDHKHFTAAAKLVMDRLLPISAFEDSKGGTGKNTISITITGVDGAKTVIGANDDAEEAEYIELDEDS